MLSSTQGPLEVNVDLSDMGGECPVVRAARVVSGKWTLLILRDLESGAKRFTELERSLSGISPRTLSQRLRVLEEGGIVGRRAYNETPPRVEYSLTPKGTALLPIIDAMRQWGEKWGSDAPAEMESRDPQAHAAGVS